MRRELVAACAVLVVAAFAAALQAEAATAHDGAHCSSNTTVPTPAWDQDCDSVRDEADNCPPRWLNDFGMRNPDQRDSDGDGLGDRCDGDDDGDGELDGSDNCRTVANPEQEDSNNDGIGDACARDWDADGVVDPRDNCGPRFTDDTAMNNPDQLDTDADGFGDVCDVDDDEDYVTDAQDNCRLVFNQDQLDADGDGRGAACDPGDAGTGPPAAGPPDRTAPVVRLGVARRLRLAELGRGLAVKVRCSEACIIRGRLMLGQRRLAKGDATLAGAGTTYVFLQGKFRRAARRLPARATLRLSVADSAGNMRAMTRRLRLRR